MINVANALHRGRIEAQKLRVLHAAAETVEASGDQLAQAMQDLELSENRSGPPRPRRSFVSRGWSSSATRRPVTTCSG